MPIDFALLTAEIGPLDADAAERLSEALADVAAERLAGSIDLYASLHAKLERKFAEVAAEGKTLRDQADERRRAADRLDGQIKEIEARFAACLERLATDRLATDFSEVLRIPTKKTSLVLLVEPEKLPGEFQRTKIEADKPALTKALAGPNAGDVAAFAQLQPTPPTIRVKSSLP